MATDKDQLHALLADYVEGSLDERQIDEAEAYLNANPAVRTVVERLIADSEMLRGLPVQRSPVDYSEDVRAAAERDLLLGEAGAAAAPRRPLGGPMLALAAMLVVGLGLGGASYWILAHRPATKFDLATNAGRDAAAAATLPADRRADAPRDAMSPLRDEGLPGEAVARRAADEPTGREHATPDGEHAVAKAVTPAPAAPMTPAREGTPASPGAGGGLGAAGGFDAAGGIGRIGGAVGAEQADGHVAEWPPELAVAARPSAAAAAPAPVAAAPSPTAAVSGALAAAADPVPPGVRAIVDAASVDGGRLAVAIAVDDVADVEPMKRLVRAIVAPQNVANNIYENVGPQNVLASTLPADLGPLVAVDVPAQMAARVRAAVENAARDGGPSPARVYEVARDGGYRGDADAKSKDQDGDGTYARRRAPAADENAPAAEAARSTEAARSPDAQQQQQQQQGVEQAAQAEPQRQQVSGESMPRNAAPLPDEMAKRAVPNVDVYVMVVPSAAAPATTNEAKPTTTPAAE